MFIVLPIVIVNCPVGVMLNISQADHMAVGIWAEPTATRDGVDIPVVQQTHRSGFSFGEGSTAVSYVFDDGLGDPAECNFTVMVTLVGQGKLGMEVLTTWPWEVAIINNKCPK